ncbi:MAG TPA: PH domain-containing protein [Microthrixaceae bacterium]|nr:PH domain-containing protein [Microthrixaceae bacterium]HMT24863.1 PH domain-containing protein [Microthrixaceae bacterium]HMT60740.1 PH domain-containing protein [Microthrixaceae bacterium]
MSLSQKHLFNDEQIVIDRHPHWWFLVPRGSVLVLAIALGAYVGLIYEFDKDSSLETPLRIVVALLVTLALGWFLLRLVAWRTTNFVVTTERCIYRSGVLRKSGIEIPLDRINTVFFSQTFFERLLRAGDLAIESAGENSRQNFSDVYDPIGVQSTIYQEMEKYENRRLDRIGGEAREAAVGAVGASITVAEQLEKLADLHARGVLTDAEFEAQKAQLLG